MHHYGRYRFGSDGWRSQGSVGEVVGFKESGRVRLMFENGRDFAFRPEEVLKVVAGYETGLSSPGR